MNLMTSTIVRSIFSALGGPLGGLANFWNEIEQKRFDKNIQILINSLKVIIANQEQEIECLCNDAKQASQAFVILEAIVQNLRREWEEAKIPQYANIVWNTLTSPEPLDKKIQIIDQFSHLSIKDIELLQHFEYKKITLEKICMCHYEKNYIYSIIPSIVKLSSNWLLEEAFDETVWTSGNSTAAIWESKCYTLTPYGRALLDLIKSI